MNLSELFDQVADKMRADVESARKALSHSGLKGAEFEETLRSFLRNYLPGSLDVSSGQVVDSAGGISRQLDVIVSDTAKTPVLYRTSQARVVPVECVYAAIEVKAYLDGQELDKALINMESLRALKKVAYLPDDLIIRSVNFYGKQWPIWPVNYFLFAYDGIDLDKIAEYLLTHYAQGPNQPLEQRIDAVCILDKGVIGNITFGSGKPMIDALPSPGSVLSPIKTRKALLLFYSLVSRYFNQTWLPNFRFVDYLGQMTFGPGE